jgi:hypothetical protein
MALGAVCRFNTVSMLSKSPAKERPEHYDEARTIRFLRRLGLIFMIFGLVLVVLAAAKT